MSRLEEQIKELECKVVHWEYCFEHLNRAIDTMQSHLRDTDKWPGKGFHKAKMKAITQLGYLCYQLNNEKDETVRQLERAKDNLQHIKKLRGEL